jgi:hypothetical protein
VYRLAYNGDIAAGQLAVFQGASEAPIQVAFLRALIRRPGLLVFDRLAVSTPDLVDIS